MSLGGASALPTQLAAILKVASRQIKEVDRHKTKQKSQNTKSFTHGKALAKLCHNAATTASKLPKLVVSIPLSLDNCLFHLAAAPKAHLQRSLKQKLIWLLKCPQAGKLSVVIHRFSALKLF